MNSPENTLPKLVLSGDLNVTESINTANLVGEKENSSISSINNDVQSVSTIIPTMQEDRTETLDLESQPSLDLDEILSAAERRINSLSINRGNPLHVFGEIVQSSDEYMVDIEDDDTCFQHFAPGRTTPTPLELDTMHRLYEASAALARGIVGKISRQNSQVSDGAVAPYNSPNYTTPNVQDGMSLASALTRVPDDIFERNDNSFTQNNEEQDEELKDEEYEDDEEELEDEEYDDELEDEDEDDLDNIMSSGCGSVRKTVEGDTEDQVMIESENDEELRNFFPATRADFREVAGTVTRVTRADFQDFHRRRHLQCFARSMDNWRNFENNALEGGNVPQYSELQFDRYRDIFLKMDITKLSPLDKFIYKLLSQSENVQDQNSLNSVMARLRRECRISPSKRDIFERLLQLQSDADFGQESEMETPKGGTESVEDFVSPTAVRYDPRMQHLLRNKSVRSNSGVVVITVLTAPGNFSCSSDCHYCPNEPGQPRSYLSTEPAVLRANQNDFDAVRQFHDRAMTLYRNGHVIDKIEVLVLGGTWSGYPRSYQEEFCRDLFYAANVFPLPLELARSRESLETEQDINVTASCRIIGLTLETRPDRISPAEIRILRRLGCTRVQLGIQHTKDDILSHVNRGHTIVDGIRALSLLKDNCYKVDIHLMPDLPASSPQVDREMFAEVLGDDELQADQWKIYPCEVTPFSRIEQWYKEGRYAPYFDTDPFLLMDLLMSVKRAIHPWIRLNRVIRDIPNPSIIAGTNVTNMRQLLLNNMAKRGLMCRCIRCREVKQGGHDLGAKLMVRQYRSHAGDEYFLSYETEDESKIFGFLRLRLRDNSGYNPKVSLFRCLEGCALIRELHVYGVVVVHGKSSQECTPYQHRGIGASLLLAADIIAAAKGFRKIAVIAGIGTREYYAKHGYEVDDTYMTKILTHGSIYNRFVQHKQTATSSIQVPYSIKIHVIDLQDAVKVLNERLPEETKAKKIPPVVSTPTTGPSYSINVFRFLRYTRKNFGKKIDYTKVTSIMFDEHWEYFDHAYEFVNRSLSALGERPFVVASVLFLGAACYSTILRRRQR
ncbi:Uncharacterized protein BXIN_0645 [Babesia sp. Xinjiang]|uniref:Uncharacterized protein n=1 Tax=Babesia sp. Xinjiang TaxID=462227 RepID=UPI000A231029|nr:Uncharacterized protein BXIN_0645 [Babesia sp. Xinjiang]ORM41871.1 Uncharacterized protein BXIN_0645 [Babesia sp. Xinjiang]